MKKRREHGAGSIFRRGKIWYVKIYDHRGRPVERSSRSTEKREALKLLRRLRDEDAVARSQGSSLGESLQRYTLAEMLEDYDRYMEAKGSRSWGPHHRRRLLEFFGAGREVRTIKAREINEDYRAWREKIPTRSSRPPSVTSINRDLQYLRAAWRLAAEDDDIPAVSRVPKIRIMSEDNIREGFVDAATFREILRNLRATPPGVYADFAEFAFFVAMRFSAIASMTWSWIDRPARCLKVPKAYDKARKGLRLKLPPPIWAIIERRWEDRIKKTEEGGELCHHVFHDQGRPLVHSTYVRRWHKATAAAGVPGLIPHDLRRSAARNLRRAGVPESVIKRIGGWKTDHVFFRYQIIDEDEVEAALSATYDLVEAEAQAAARFKTR